MGDISLCDERYMTWPVRGTRSMCTPLLTTAPKAPMSWGFCLGM